MNNPSVRRLAMVLLFAAFVSVLAGCGNKGELVRPAPPATE